MSQAEQERQQQLEQEQQFQPKVTTWDQINQPGAYVDIQSGELYSIPKQAVLDGQLIIDRQGSQQIELLQVSKNPFLSPLQAARIATRNNVQVNFQ